MLLMIRLFSRGGGTAGLTAITRAVLWMASGWESRAGRRDLSASNSADSGKGNRWSLAEGEPLGRTQPKGAAAPTGTPLVQTRAKTHSSSSRTMDLMMAPFSFWILDFG